MSLDKNINNMAAATNGAVFCMYLSYHFYFFTKIRNNENFTLQFKVTDQTAGSDPYFLHKFHFES